MLLYLCRQNWYEISGKNPRHLDSFFSPLFRFRFNRIIYTAASKLSFDYEQWTVNMAMATSTSLKCCRYHCELLIFRFPPYFLFHFPSFFTLVLMYVLFSTSFSYLFRFFFAFLFFSIIPCPSLAWYFSIPTYDYFACSTLGYWTQK